MENEIKLTDEELGKFNNLKNQIQKNVFELGELYLEKLEFEEIRKRLVGRETDLSNKVGDFKKQETDLLNEILGKYGEGNLNIQTGIFTPAKK